MENYQNPTSLSPYGNQQPGPFLSGWMLPDKINDYRTMMNLSNDASGMANQKSRNELNEFNLNSGLRGQERQLKGMTLGSQIQDQPMQAKLASTNLAGDLSAAPHLNESKIWAALMKLPREQQDYALEQFHKTSGLLKGFTDKDFESADPQALLSYLKKGNIDTSDWMDPVTGQLKKDPNTIRAELKHIQGLDPEFFKISHEDFRANQANQTHKDIGAAHNATSIEVAKIIAESRKARGSTTAAAYRAALREKAHPILMRMNEPDFDPDNPNFTPDEAATLQEYLNEVRDATYQEGAKAQGKTDTVKGALGAIQPSKPGQKPYQPKSVPAPINKPGLQTQPQNGPPKNPDKKKMDSMKEGDPYYWDGVLYHKGDR